MAGDIVAYFQANNYAKDLASYKGLVAAYLGTRKYIAPNSIFNPKCAYVLIAIGRASIQQGVKLVMPAWGADGYFEYPNAVRVPVLIYFATL